MEINVTVEILSAKIRYFTKVLTHFDIRIQIVRTLGSLNNPPHDYKNKRTISDVHRKSFMVVFILR